MEVVPELISLGAGCITGWFFERRASREARLHNEDLIGQVSALKVTMLSRGGNLVVESEETPAGDLAANVTKRAIATQGPEGCVDRATLIAHFVGRGFARSDIETAIGSLCGAGIAREEGSWLRIR